MFLGYTQFFAVFFVFYAETQLFSADFLGSDCVPQYWDEPFVLGGHDTRVECTQMMGSCVSQGSGYVIGDPVMTSAALHTVDDCYDLFKDFLSNKQHTDFLSSQEEEDDAMDDALSDDIAQKGVEKERKEPEKSVHKRLKILKGVLAEAWSSFGDCKASPYNAKRRDSFLQDILHAMHNGADIREEGGRFRYFGELKGAPEPSENVSTAMFHLLSENQKSLFDLTFNLYRKGYRAYSPDFIACLEGALVIGNVHPQKLWLKKDDLRLVMQEEWMKINQKKEEGKGQTTFEQYIRMVEVRSKKLYGRQVRIMQCLWDLEESGDLAVLCNFLKKKTDCFKKGSAERCGSLTQRVSVGDSVVQFLRLNKNIAVPIDRLVENIPLPKYVRRNPQSLLRVVLDLARGGPPIIYDKDTSSVTLLEEKIPAVIPAENTNLLTMLYDLIKKYGTDLLREEVAYYADCQGHFPEELRKKDIQCFYNLVNKYKAILAIHEHIAVSCCKAEQRRCIDVRRRIWRAVMRDKVVKSLSYYKKTIPSADQEDLDAISSMQRFMETQEFTVFCNHVQQSCIEKPKLTREDFIKESLRKETLSLTKLWTLCRDFGMQQIEDLWDAAQTLTQSTSGGRLFYLPELAVFSWDCAGFYSPREEVERVSEIYSLQNDYPCMQQKELVYMLTQRGFHDANGSDIHLVLQGLELLGLRSTKSDSCALQRGVLDAMITSSISQKKSARDSAQESAIAQEVYSWLDSGAMEHLWKAYLHVKSNKIKSMARCAEGAPSAKRLKFAYGGIALPKTFVTLDDPKIGPEGIIERHIPALKTFLISKGLCFA